MIRIYLFTLLLFLTACQQTGQTAREIDMYNSSGDMVGTARFNEQPDGVKVSLKVEGLTPGFHGIHLHEHPLCEGPQFITAGNHLNPTGKKHGLMHPEGAHLGDLPNIEVDGSGLVETELMVAEATLLEGKTSLFTQGGVALIIDSGQDDGVSQPSGDSGLRELCGVLKMNEKDKVTEKSPTDPTEDGEEEKEAS